MAPRIKPQRDRKSLTPHERRLVISIAKLSKAGILRVLAAAGAAVDGREANNSIGVPGCMGAAVRGPHGCTCKVRCCIPATDELAARWWGWTDQDEQLAEQAMIEAEAAADRRRERRHRQVIAEAEKERQDAIASGRLITLKGHE